MHQCSYAHYPRIETHNDTKQTVHPYAYIRDAALGIEDFQSLGVY